MRYYPLIIGWLIFSLVWTNFNVKADLNLPSPGDDFKIEVEYSTQSYELINKSTESEILSIIEVENEYLLKYIGLEEIESVTNEQVFVIEDLTGNSTETSNLSYWIKSDNNETINGNLINGSNVWINETSTTPKTIDLSGYPFPFPHDGNVFPSLYSMYRAENKIQNSEFILEDFTANNSVLNQVEREIKWKNNPSFVHEVDIIQQLYLQILTKSENFQNYSENITITLLFSSIEIYEPENQILLYIDSYFQSMFEIVKVPNLGSEDTYHTYALQIEVEFESQTMVDASWFDLNNPLPSNSISSSPSISSSGDMSIQNSILIVSVLVILFLKFRNIKTPS